MPNIHTYGVTIDQVISTPSMMTSTFERKEVAFNSANVASFSITNGNAKEIESYGFTEDGAVADIDEERSIKVTAKTNTTVTVKCTGSDAQAAGLKAFIVLRPV